MDNNKPTPAATTHKKQVASTTRFFNFDSPGVVSRKKFEVRRLGNGRLALEGDIVPGLFRLYVIRGLVSQHWREGSEKVTKLFPEKSNEVTLLLRSVEDALVAEVRMKFEGPALVALQAVGKTSFERIGSHFGAEYGIVFLRLSEPDEQAELRKVAVNPLRLGAWTLERLRTRIIEWAEERL